MNITCAHRATSLMYKRTVKCYAFSSHRINIFRDSVVGNFIPKYVDDLRGMLISKFLSNFNAIACKCLKDRVIFPSDLTAGNIIFIIHNIFIRKI